MTTPSAFLSNAGVRDKNRRVAGIQKRHETVLGKLENEGGVLERTRRGQRAHVDLPCCDLIVMVSTESRGVDTGEVIFVSY